VDTDRNLLFGVLALQLDIIDRDGFVTACAAWATRKQQPLADVLLSLGLLTADDRREVERLMERRLKKHGGDVQASLAEAADSAARSAVAAVGDDDLSRSLPPTPSQWLALPTDAPTCADGPRYAMLRLAGTGGLGRVWLVRDASVGREVALKELRPDRADVGYWTRFVREAQVTGQLEHPGIVPVYEVGRRPEDNQPFYTMRFVRGRTLKDAIAAYHERRRRTEAGPLDLRELLGAFVAVCQAVGYAHSRGVLHRDLKPANVALGDYGEVMVLDWGLAKVLSDPRASASGEPDGDASTAAPPVAPGAAQDPTQAGAVLGTPQYMAPEQAEGRLDLMDARTDVYGLGAILYHLLTAEAPFAGPVTPEVLDKVRHDPPRRPRELVGDTPRALEAVCLKALAKRREERYPSAKALAAEVQRFLADQPVTAYREPLPTRLARWGRRHKPLVTGAAALLVAAVVALTAGTLLLGRANAQIERERDQTRKQRDRADANFQKARQAVDDYLTRVSENKLLQSPLPGLQPLRRELLQAALSYYQDFAEEHQDDPALTAELARAYYRVGKITAEIGSQDEARAASATACGLWETLVRDEPARADYRAQLAGCYLALGRLEIRNPEGAAEHLRYLEQARDLYAQLAAQEAGRVEYRRGLAESYDALERWCSRNGRPREQIEHGQKALGLWEELARQDPTLRTNLASTAMNIGFFHTRDGRPAEALKFQERARDIYAELAKENPNDLESRNGLRRAYMNIGHLYQGVTGRPDLALEAFREAEGILAGLTRDNPAVALFQRNDAGNDKMIAKVLADMHEYGEAERYVRRALETLDRLKAIDPGNVSDLADAAELYAVRGRIEMETNRPRQAVASNRLACELSDKVAAANPGDVENQNTRARSYRLLGMSQLRAGEVPAGLESLDKAVAVMEQIDPDTRRKNHLALSNLVVAAVNLAQAQRALGNKDGAARNFRRVVAVWEDDLRGEASDSELLRLLAQGFVFYAQLQAETADPAGGLRTARQAEAVSLKLPDFLPKDLYLLACARSLASSLVGAGKPEPTPGEQAERQKYADQAIADLKELFAKGGLVDPQVLKSDSALRPLASRPDFQQLVAEQEEKARAAREEQQRFARAFKLARDGELARAVEQIKPALESKHATPVTAYNAACVYSLASAAAHKDNNLPAAEQQKLGQRYADRAMELLRQAVAKGYKDAAHMQKDPDLAALRQRDDFKKLVADLEAATKPKDKKEP
jgi:serine/threonine-protein kinase